MGVVILTAREPESALTAVGHRRYHGRTERLALTEPVGLDALGVGVVLPRHRKELAYRADVSEKTARRMLEEWLDEQVNPRAEPEDDRLPPGLLQAIALKEGNVKAAMDEYYDDPDVVRRVRSSVYRAIAAVDLGFLLALKGGVASWERYLEIGVHEWTHRNEMWEVDETKLPFRYRLPDGRVFDDLWLLLVVDAYSGLWLNAQVTIGPANGLITAAVLARAMVGGEIDGVPYGGHPEAIGMDNGEALKSDAVKEVLRLGYVPEKYARPYTPTEKPHVERANGTLKHRHLSGIIGNTKSPKVRRWKATGELRRDGTPKRERVEESMLVPVDNADLLLREDLTELVYARIHQRNTRDVSERDRLTSIQRYGAGGPPPIPIPAVTFWDRALPVNHPEYIGERRGMHVDNAWRIVPGTKLNRRRLIARTLPGFDPVYIAGTAETRRPIGQLKRNADETAKEKRARIKRNDAFTAKLRGLTHVSPSTAQARAETPGTPAYESDKAAERHAASDDQQLADPLAALALPELDDLDEAV